jgi:integrase
MTRTLHRDPKRRCLPLAEWPVADRTSWLAALAPGDFLDEAGERARYAAASNRKTEKGYGRWLAWLQCRDLLDDRTPPAERITPERVCAYIADLSVFDASATILSRLQELHDAAAALDGSRDWHWIRQIAKRIRTRHQRAGSKRQRMVHVCDLLGLGETLMAGASKQSTTRLRAMQFRDGLIIALLAARPLRLRNLAGLELERTLVPMGEGWWITVPPSETKTRTPIEAPWPAGLALDLDHYLREHRPVLCSLRNRWTRPVANALWVSTHGSPMTRIAIYDVFTRRTAEAFGQPINPHLFRDCAATSIAIEDPEHVRIASQILGHRSTATTERYYNQAQAIDAARRYQDFLLALRNGTMDKEQA